MLSWRMLDFQVRDRATLYLAELSGSVASPEAVVVDWSVPSKNLGVKPQGLLGQWRGRPLPAGTPHSACLCPSLCLINKFSALELGCAQLA